MSEEDYFIEELSWCHGIFRGIVLCFYSKAEFQWNKRYISGQNIENKVKMETKFSIDIDGLRYLVI